MIRRNAGFTLVEMLIVIAIIGFILAGTSDMFISMLRTHRQQSRIAETNIEGIIGLELLRQDLEKAGYGLPWNGPFIYAEKNPDTYSFNDGPASVPGAANAPRGIVSANDVAAANGILGNTDYLTIKAANVATNTACNKWMFLLESGGTSTVSWWTPDSENLLPNDRAIVISPGTPNTPNERALISGSTLFSAADAFQASVASPETRVIYGIDGTGPNPLRMPFNRADYFVMQPSSTEMPGRCAKETGILYKAVVNQNGGLSYLPLLDCVADMQVVFRLDRNNDGTLDSDADILTDTVTGLPLTAPETRNQVKEVRVYILAHEGQRDTNYTHPVNSIDVGRDLGSSHGRNFNLTAITDWQNYRWKVYTLVAQLNNLK